MPASAARKRSTCAALCVPPRPMKTSRWRSTKRCESSRSDIISRSNVAQLPRSHAICRLRAADTAMIKLVFLGKLADLAGAAEKDVAGPLDWQGLLDALPGPLGEAARGE